MSILKQWRRLQKDVSKITAQNISILYHRNGLLAIQKPYGIPVHSGPKVHHSIIGLLPELEYQLQLPQKSLALANRLDKNVSGVLLLTYEADMAERIAEMYREQRVTKKYLAILVGNTNTSTGTLVGNIKEEKRKRNGGYKQVVDTESVDSKWAAKTHYKILDKNKKSCMLCAFQTNTGYKHQIRVHATQLLQSPILGDHKYHDGVYGPQKLPLRVIQQLGIEGLKTDPDKLKGKIRPWQRGLIPLHLFAQRVLLSGLEDDGNDVKIVASLPDYFLKTMNDCNLMFQRDEYEVKMLNKKKVYSGPLKESIFISKGISPDSIDHETSL